MERNLLLQLLTCHAGGSSPQAQLGERLPRDYALAGEVQLLRATPDLSALERCVVARCGRVARWG